MACGDREPRGHESPPASSTRLGMGRVRWHFLRPSAASPLGLAQNSVCMVTLDFCVLLFNGRINLCFPFSCRASMLWPPHMEIPTYIMSFSYSVPFCKLGRGLGAWCYTKHFMRLISFNPQKTPETGRNIQICK